jgi:hypothetical protein
MRAQPKLQPGTWARYALAVVCVFLIVLTGFLAAVHVHSSVPSHSCSICALTHSGVVPAALGTPAPVIASSALVALSFQAPRVLLSVFDQFIRPPPLG